MAEEPEMVNCTTTGLAFARGTMPPNIANNRDAKIDFMRDIILKFLSQGL
jgi:hypothetical protein